VPLLRHSQPHKVVVIGCTSNPTAGELKDFKALFCGDPAEPHGRALYVPYPDYASRLIIWRKAIDEAVTFGVSEWQGDHPCFEPRGWRTAVGEKPPKRSVELPEEFDLSILAHVSQFYSAGSIRRAVKMTLTRRRVERLDKRPLTEREFVSALARCPVTYEEDDHKYREFTADITGLRDRRDAIKALAAGEGGGDDKKKGKKKK
jgi:IQ and AAA domain-containing protein